MECITYGYVDVLDDKVFTLSRANEWNDYIVDNYKLVFDRLKEIIDGTVPIKFSLNKLLLKETIVDAIIGMRKIVDSKNNSIEDPNSFKVASYLAYWWLRHKPIAIYYSEDIRADKVKAVRVGDESDEEYEQRCKRLYWQLNHINELVAVQFVINYIFDLDKELCGHKECTRIAKKDDKFSFVSFDDMKDVVLDKLLYYFSYRALAPKMIEHILEGYTLHPAWGYTGSHWDTGDAAIKDGKDFNEIM